MKAGGGDADELADGAGDADGGTDGNGEVITAIPIASARTNITTMISPVAKAPTCAFRSEALMFGRVGWSAAFAALLILGAASAPAQDAAGTPSFGEPSISPDHSEIAFVSGGNVWSVPAAGGVARLLVAFDGTATRPLFSPDGSRIAFVSTRPGAVGIYVVTLRGGVLTRLTHDDVTPSISGWSPDGRFVYYASTANNIEYFSDIMRVSVDGGTPMRVLGERFAMAQDAAPSPDGEDLAYTRGGYTQWWRRGHSHMDESAIVVHASNGSETAVTDGESKDRWPMWGTGDTLYFVSDRSGSDELWARSGGHLRKLTSLGGEPVLWPTISRDGATIVFEHGLAVWSYDTRSGAVTKLAIATRGLPDDPPAPTHVVLSSGLSDLSLSPDGRKLAFVARARAFAVAAQGGGDAAPIPAQAGTAHDLPLWAPDSRRVAYVIDRGDETAIATYEFPDGPAKTLTPAGHHDDYPHWSPDGTQLAFERDGTELHVITVATGVDRVVARGKLDRRPFGDEGDVAFSPAGDWIAYIDQAADGFPNLRVVPAAGGESHQISFLPNGNDGSVSWSPDGTRIFFVTSQRTEDGMIAQIDLLPRAPHFREDEFRGLFTRLPGQPVPRTQPEPAVTAAPKPSPTASAAPTHAPATHAAATEHHTRIEFAGIRERLTMLPVGLDVVSALPSTDGNALVFVANAATQQNLYTFPIDETSGDPPVARQLTSTFGMKTNLTLAPDGKTAYVLDGGRIVAASLATPGVHPVPVAAALDIDFGAEKLLVFRQSWGLIDRWFADPHFHGTDWPAMRRQYEPYAEGARTPGELRRVISLMIGELNASHSGIYAPRAPGAPRVWTGRLGVQWDAQEYARSGRLRIAEIVPLGPIALAGHVAVGDDVVAVAGTPTEHADIDALLANRIGMRTEVRIAPHGDLAAARTVVVLPVDTPTEQSLLYASWVASRRAYVERVSGGRLGYVHILDMGQESLAKFGLDLDTQNREKDGVIVDVRNNEGGFVDPYAIDILTRREYLKFIDRFYPTPPERTTLGQRTLDRPTVLVTNEHSLSDAEDFSEAYHVLHAGSIVGEPTAGWIMFTDGTALADGSYLRLPTIRVIAHDGVDMELHPRPVDVTVADPPGAAARGDDPQLDAAVHELLRRLHH